MYGIVAIVLCGAGVFMKDTMFIVASGLFAVADAVVSLSSRFKK